MLTTTTTEITLLTTARAQLAAARTAADRAAAEVRDLCNDLSDARFGGALAISIAKIELRRRAERVRECEATVRALGGRV